MLSPKQKKSRKLTLKIIIIFLTVCFTFFIIWQIFKPSVYQLNNNFSLLLSDANGQTFLVAMPVTDSNGLYVFIAGDQILNVPRRLGLYPVKNIYELGDQQKIGGGQLLKESVQENLYIPVDAYLHVRGNIDFDSNNSNSSFASKQLKQSLLISFLPGSDTDLGYLDRLKMLYFFTVNRTSAWDLLDLRILTENNQVTPPDPVSLDSLKIGDLDFYAFADQRMIKNDFTIGIYNAGNCPQLAAKTKIILKHMGAQTVDIQDLTIPDSTMILFKNKIDQKSKLINRLKRIFRINTIQEYEFSQRADMIFVFGSDYCQIFP